MVWKSHPDLNIPRFKHACGAVRFGNGSIIIIAGGIDNHNIAISNVETLRVLEAKDGEPHFAPGWQFGPSLPMPLSDAASATTFDQKALFILGGSMIQDMSQSVYRFSCPDSIDNDGCVWNTLDYELKRPSAMGLSLVLPQVPMVTRGYANARDCYQGNTSKKRVINISIQFAQI